MLVGRTVRCASGTRVVGLERPLFQKGSVSTTTCTTFVLQEDKCVTLSPEILLSSQSQPISDEFSPHLPSLVCPLPFVGIHIASETT